MNLKAKNAKKRKNTWAKRICLTKKNYNYIQEQKEKNKYKTMAGTLDYIINKYKDS